MSQQNTAPVGNPTGAYGYQSDEVKVSPFNFGLNAGNCFLTKFEWIHNGGKDGAEQEALDVVFTINGTDKSYRMFPVVKAFGKNNEEITDPKAPEMIDSFTDFGARIVHILHCYADDASVRAALSRPFDGFKQYCQAVMSILPKNYKDIPLDIFLQWGWNLGDKERTYLEIPTKMKQGKWLCPAQLGNWKENRVENPADTVREALYYTNEKNEKHLFVKNGWFMNSNFAHQQKQEGIPETSNNAEATPSASSMSTTTPSPKPSAW